MRAEVFSEELVNGIKEVLASQALSIILYGSVARGEAGEESDVDVAVIVKGRLSEDAQDKLSDFIVDMNLKYETVFSVIDIDNQEVEKWENVSPFYKNVKKDGVVLWKAA